MRSSHRFRILNMNSLYGAGKVQNDTSVPHGRLFVVLFGDGTTVCILGPSELLSKFGGQKSRLSSLSRLPYTNL